MFVPMNARSTVWSLVCRAVLPGTNSVELEAKAHELQAAVERMVHLKRIFHSKHVSPMLREIEDTWTTGEPNAVLGLLDTRCTQAR